MRAAFNTISKTYKALHNQLSLRVSSSHLNFYLKQLTLKSRATRTRLGCLHKMAALLAVLESTLQSAARQSFCTCTTLPESGVDSSTAHVNIDKYVEQYM